MEIPEAASFPKETMASSSRFNVRRVLRLLVAVAVFVTPLLFLPFTGDVLDFNKSIFLFLISGVGIVLFLVDMIREGILRYRPSTFAWPMIGLVVAAIVSVGVSVSRYTSIFGVGNNHALSLLSVVSLVIFFFLVSNSTEDRGKSLRNLLMASLSIALFLGVLQMLGVSVFGSSFFGKPFFNTVGSLNSLGFLAAALLPFFLIRPEAEVSWQNLAFNILRFVGLVSSIVILAILNWGYIWVVAFVGVLAYIAFTSSTEVSRGRMKFFALPMAIIVLGAFLWVIDFQWTAVKSKFPVEVAPKHSVSYRISADAIKQRPFGYGLENFVIGYDQHRPTETVNNALFQARFIDSTSEFATMMVEGGIVLILAFLALLFFFVRELVRNVQDRFGGDSGNGKLWASALALLVMFFFYPMNVTVLFVLFVLLALMGIRSSRESVLREINLEDRGAYSLLGSVGFIVGLVGVLVGGYFVINQYIANIQIARAAKATDRSVAIDHLVRAVNSYPQDSRVYRSLSQLLLEQIAEDLKTGPQGKPKAEFDTQLQNKISSAIRIAVRATEVDPADSENWMNRGFVYQNLITLVNGSDEAAINMYHEVITRSPANALAHVRMGNIHLTLADVALRAGNRDSLNSHLKAAEDEYKTAIELYNNYGQALYNLAAVYDRKGELSQAIKQFEKIQAASPRDPSILFQLGLLYYRNNQKDNALRAWEQAVLSFPDYSNAHWYLSLIYEEREDLKKALSEVEIVEKLNPNNELVEQRIEALRAGLRQIVPPEDVLDQTPLNNQQ